MKDRLAVLGISAKMPPKPSNATITPPEHTAEMTVEELDRRGWVLWQCRLLKDELIVVAIDETTKGYPSGYPVYTIEELRQILDMEDSTLRLVHEVKKQCCATVAAVKDNL